MHLILKKSKSLGPLIGAFITMAALVITLWLINLYFSERIYSVLESNSDNSGKMHIISSLIETARKRTQISSQLLITDDFFERDELNMQMMIQGAKFARLRQQLLDTNLTDKEKAILEKQGQLVTKLLPRQRLLGELVMSELKEDQHKAQEMFYHDIVPWQTEHMDYFIEMGTDIRDGTIQTSEEVIANRKKNVAVQHSLVIIFLALMLIVSFITIKRILSIESELTEANDELSRLNTVKSDFVSLVSHELRTPLTSIKSFAEILMDDIEDMDHQTQKRYLSIIDSESDRLTRLVTNILDLQKMDSNKMTWNDEELVLNNIVKESIESFSGAYESKGITLDIASIPEDLSVIADADKLKQVLANFLSNALKFTDEGGVLATLHQQKVKTINGGYINMARVAISDSGMGIPEDQLTKVFDNFHQVDNSATRKKGGSGLGLDICRKIVEHYEGNIWVESKLEKGSTFYFEIPLHHASKKEIGETLVELGMITDDQLKIAIDKQ